MDTKITNLKNFRASKNRQMIIEILASAKMPVTVDFIYQKLKNNSSISLSTVYRILEKLTINHIIKKAVFLDDNKARYELIRQDHSHYLICTQCNEMIPIKACPLNELERNLEANTGYNVQGHKLEIYGQCAKCKH